jgi:molecular chaperone DnaK
VTLSNPNAAAPFRSAPIPLSPNGAFFTEVVIPPGKTSTLTIELADGRGTLCKLSPDSVTITHGTGVPSAQLNHSLGIQLVDRQFAPILHKGAALPATARETFRTSGPLSRSDTDTLIRIPVVQGERSRGDRNRVVDMLEIRPTDLKYDLAAGTKVEMLFMIDESNLLTVVADVELMTEQLEARINLGDVHPADPETLRRQLAEAEERFTILRGQAAESAEAQRLIAKLEAEGTLTVVRDQVRVAVVEAGAAATAEDRLRDLQADLDDIADAIQLPDLAQEAANLLVEAGQLVDRMGTQADRQELALLRTKVDEAVASKHPAAVRVVLERINIFIGELERRDPNFPVRLFYSMQHWLPASGQASALFRRGERAIAAGDRRELQATLRELVELLPEDDRGKVEHGLERM